MTVYLFETWIVKPEHEKRHALIWKQYVNYMKENPTLFEGIKSMKLCKKLLGEGFATFVQIVEFSNLEEKVCLDNKLSKDKESIAFKGRLMLVKNSETNTEILCEPYLEYN
jgi:hypothetical protein